MILDLSAFHKALASLARAIARSRQAPEDEELRDAVIQRFEFTFELAWKTIKRQLEQEVAEPASVDRLAFHDLLREAAERGLLSDVEAWMEYRRQLMTKARPRPCIVALSDFTPRPWRWPKRSAGETVLDIEPRHLDTVREILRSHIPDLAVRAFGSRARGGSKPHSDLDLVVMTTAPLPMPVKVRLEEAFAESSLPFKVDVLYWDEVAENFRQLIAGAWEPVQQEASRPGG